MPAFPDMGARNINDLVEFLITGSDKGDGSGADERSELAEVPQRRRDASSSIPTAIPPITPPWGTLNAIDLNAGTIRWKIPFGEFPELAAKGLKNTGSDNYGGPVVTAGGLLFIGATNFDKKFRAYDKLTGKLLWETTLPAAGNATPSIYTDQRPRVRRHRRAAAARTARRPAAASSPSRFPNEVPMVRRLLFALAVERRSSWPSRPRPRSSWRGIPTITPARSPSATSATSGSRTRTAPARIASPINTAREIYPRFSPDGKWIAFSSNRYGNNDVFVIPADRRRAEAADVPHRQRRSGRLDARSARASCSARRAATARSRTSRRCIRLPIERRTGTAAAGRLGLLGQLLARRQVAGLQSPSLDLVAPALSRQLRRGPVDRQPRRQDLHEAARRRALQPLLADVGRRRRDLFRRRSAAEREDRQAGQPRRAQERQQHLQDSREGRPAGAGDQARRRQPVLAVDVERRQDDRLRRQLRHLEARRRDRTHQRDQDRHRHRREGQRDRIRDRAPTKSTRSTSRRRAAAR